MSLKHNCQLSIVTLYLFHECLMFDLLNVFGLQFTIFGSIQQISVLDALYRP